jgi:hypothetical protein
VRFGRRYRGTNRGLRRRGAVRLTAHSILGTQTTENESDVRATSKDIQSRQSRCARLRARCCRGARDRLCEADPVGDADASMFDPGDLSCIGDETPLRDAAQMVQFPIFIAHSPLALTESIERVLMCSSDQVEVDYESGVLVRTGVSHLLDPVMEWKTLAEEYAEFSTGTVRGVRPASRIRRKVPSGSRPRRRGRPDHRDRGRLDPTRRPDRRRGVTRADPDLTRVRLRPAAFAPGPSAPGRVDLLRD